MSPSPSLAIRRKKTFLLTLSQSCQIIPNSRYVVYCLCKIGQHQSDSIMLHSLVAAEKDLSIDLHDQGAQPRSTEHGIFAA